MCHAGTLKPRVELRFMDVLDHQIPYACVPCDFKTGYRRKLDRHLESSNHRRRLIL